MAKQTEQEKFFGYLNKAIKFILIIGGIMLGLSILGALIGAALA